MSTFLCGEPHKFADVVKRVAFLPRESVGREYNAARIPNWVYAILSICRSAQFRPRVSHSGARDWFGHLFYGVLSGCDWSIVKKIARVMNRNVFLQAASKFSLIFDTWYCLCLWVSFWVKFEINYILISFVCSLGTQDRSLTLFITYISNCFSTSGIFYVNIEGESKSHLTLIKRYPRTK